MQHREVRQVHPLSQSAQGTSLRSCLSVKEAAFSQLCSMNCINCQDQGVFAQDFYGTLIQSFARLLECTTCHVNLPHLQRGVEAKHLPDLQNESRQQTEEFNFCLCKPVKYLFYVRINRYLDKYDLMSQWAFQAQWCPGKLSECFEYWSVC